MITRMYYRLPGGEASLEAIHEPAICHATYVPMCYVYVCSNVQYVASYVNPISRKFPDLDWTPCTVQLVQKNQPMSKVQPIPLVTAVRDFMHSTAFFFYDSSYDYY